MSSPFTVSWTYDDVRHNLSQQYKLKEMSIDFPIFESIETKKEIYDYLSSAEKIISTKKGWRIKKDIYISNFDFKKFIMWKDLDESNWKNLSSNNVNDIFFPNEEECYDSDYEIDDEKLDLIKSEDVCTVLDADSSQFAVLEKVKDGEHLVVEGPPGTGKSQTIVNLIADLMYNQKSILFVSEKKAALDVVKSRLDDLGIGVGCLELHGSKADKKKFLQEIESVLTEDYKDLKDTNTYKLLDDTKSELKEYSDAIYEPFGELHLTPYYLIGMYVSNSTKLEELDQYPYLIEMTYISRLSEQLFGKIHKNLKKINETYVKVEPVLSNPLNNISPKDLTPIDNKRIQENLDEIIVDLNNYEETITKLREDIGINLSYDFSIDDLENSYKYIKPGLELLEDKDKLIELIDIISYFQEKLMDIPNPDVLNLDFDKIQGQIDNLISEEKTIRINSSFINDNINHKNIINDFMDHEKEIDSSNLKPALKDPDLINKLNLFKDKKDSFLGKRFNSNFKRCKQEFHQYYNFNVSDNQIIEDFDRIIQCDEELALLRNQISTYYKEFIDNRAITLEYNKLTSWHNKVEAIKNQLYNYSITLENNSINELNDKIKQLNQIKKKLKHKIEDNTTTGEFYFKDAWKSDKSDIGTLK